MACIATRSQTTTIVNHDPTEKTSSTCHNQKKYRHGEDDSVPDELETGESRHQRREDTSRRDGTSSQQPSDTSRVNRSLPAQEERPGNFPTLATYKLDSIREAWPEARCKQYLATLEVSLPADHVSEARKLFEELEHSLLLLSVSGSLTTRQDGGSAMSSNAPACNMNRGTQMHQRVPSEVVQPLQSSADSWSAARSNHFKEDSPEMVNRKVRALLNKLTRDNFDSISDQVIDWANKSKKENDGRILKQVVALIFEHHVDEAHWSEMYAKLCCKLMEKLSPEVKDENVLDTAGNKVHGGHLFRKYLMSRCQEDYERGWSKRYKLAAAGKAADDAVKQAANEKSKAEAEAVGKETTKEAEILSDEYYAAQKAKRQGLGLVRFIGELFKLNMLTERIMHECVKKLLSNIENPEEEDIESLCRLMMTVGKMLDHEKANSHVNVYFTRMTNMAQSKNLTSRARFMIQDVIDARNNHWV
ncbi:uncharacterized protein MELLADRAFT_94140 [Melampsora larici-populina 98AG31]|uniref:MIF4G domain-containing protein n=1 Tax=Melampsora larici-populina (strain 98AG31 / pathotype 3-4-7) TaxID=747676 RepID=F4S6M0_MELLP|nr:uncharacterized protein MELLADRAFT_94140 [Melampsora larici-populina 98AG31]EGF99713.1 hypothetical protein MELLADRAFT_94140 [Melampsora larici-populina 98AG31]